MAVRPIKTPMRARRTKPSSIACRTGELGCSSSVPNEQAEIMKAPSPAASIAYSGQCFFGREDMTSPRLRVALDEPDDVAIGIFDLLCAARAERARRQVDGARGDEGSPAPAGSRRCIADVASGDRNAPVQEIVV